MATGTNGIATRANANSLKPGSYSSDLSRCITYDSAISAGFEVNNFDRYRNNINRLVRYSDLIVPIKFLTFTFIIDISSDENLYNKGPITLSKLSGTADIIKPISYAREVEATEVGQDASGIPLEYSNTQVEECDETGMTLSTVDEVLQVAQEFEEQDQILGAINISRLGITLTKGDSSTNLLDASTYGPVAVSSQLSKTVTFTIYRKQYASSDDGTYKLSYSGSNYLMNVDGIYPKGSLHRSSSNKHSYQNLTVSGAGTYTFDAYWEKSAVVDPSVPTSTYTFRLRFALNRVIAYQIRVNFSCTLYSSTGAVLGTCSVNNQAYKLDELPIDHITEAGSSSYYFINLWTGNTIPKYVRVSTNTFSTRSSSSGNWVAVSSAIQNTLKPSGSPTLSGSGTVYSTLNPRRNSVYTVDCLVGGIKN